MHPTPLWKSPAVLGALVLLALLHALGIFAYVTRQVMVPVWMLSLMPLRSESPEVYPL